MSDPLSLVRQAVISNTPIQYAERLYTIGSHRFHDSTKTCFKKSVRGKEGDLYYTLRDVIFFLENSELSVPEYRKKALLEKVNAIQELDKDSLKEFLTGVIETCAQIDFSVAASLSASSAVAVKEGASTLATTPAVSSATVPAAGTVATSLQATQQGPSDPRQASKSNELQRQQQEETEESRQARKAGLKRKDAIESQRAHGLDDASIAADKQILAQLRSQEVAAQTRNTVLMKSGMDFSFAMKLFNDKVLKAMAQAKAGAGDDHAHKRSRDGSAAAGAPHPASSTAAGNRPAHTTGTPIIIVPTALTSCITSLNAVDLLERGVYVTVEEKTKQGAKREQEQYISRVVPGQGSRKVAYKIIDNPKFLRPEDWDRVVCVFATGQAWQFKEYKWPQPAELFQHVLGVHLMLDDRAVDQSVLTWNCRVLKVFRFKRHLDAEATNEFWALLDDFMKVHKPWMLPSQHA